MLFDHFFSSSFFLFLLASFKTDLIHRRRPTTKLKDKSKGKYESERERDGHGERGKRVCDTLRKDHQSPLS